MAEERDDVNEETGQIRDQIQETRDQMGETINAIQDKLSFSNISEQVSEHITDAVETAKEAVYDATLGKAVNLMKNISDEIADAQIVATVRKNPVPFILIGAGAGLLAYQAFAGGRGKSTDAAKPKARKQLRSSPADGGDETSGVVKAIRGSAASVSEGAAGVLDTAYEKVGRVGSAARDQYETYMEENPLAVGAVALALGAAVGMAIPVTRYEERVVGPARQELMDKAKGAVSELLGQTQEAVADAARSITESAAEAAKG